MTFREVCITCDNHVICSDYDLFKVSGDVGILNLCTRYFQQNSQKTALTELSTGRRVTYGQLDELIETLANVLENLNLNEKEVKRVGLILPNCIEYVVFMLATWRIRASVVLINHLSSTDELQKYLKITSCDVVVTSARNESKVKKAFNNFMGLNNKLIILMEEELHLTNPAINELNSNNFYFFLNVSKGLIEIKSKKLKNGMNDNICNRNIKNGSINDDYRIYSSKDNYCNQCNSNNSNHNDKNKENSFQNIKTSKQSVSRNRNENTNINLETEMAAILFSSGTTGVPKGVMQSHANLVTSLLVLNHPNIYEGVEDMDNSILFQPMSHGYGMFRALFCLSLGINIFLMDKFNLELYLQTIEKYKVSSLQLVPPVAIMLCKSHITKNYDLTSVGSIFSSAAPMGVPLEEELKITFNKKLKIVQGYGMTENTGFLTMIPGNLFLDSSTTIREIPPGTVGKLCPGITITVVDPETGKTLGTNQRGEFLVRGNQIMLGYLNNKDATKQTIINGGWMRTGDLGYYNKDKFFFVVDRLKEVIKCKGLQVAPAELESILIEHPCVADVAVVGVYHPTFGEAPQAWIVRKEGLQDHECNEYQIMNWLAEKVSPFKRLSGGVKFVQKIPKSASGKILRKEMKAVLHMANI